MAEVKVSYLFSKVSRKLFSKQNRIIKRLEAETYLRLGSYKNKFKIKLFKSVNYAYVYVSYCATAA